MTSLDDSDTTRPTRLSRALFFVHRLPASDRVIFHILLFLVAASGLLLAVQWSTEQTQTVPASDGILYEGMLGTVRFINPVLATSQVDRDLSALIYQSILRVTTDGQLTPDLARSIEVNDVGTEYLLTLRQNAQFHDGRPVTARDVVFTYQLAQDQDIMSPHRGSWSGVTIEQVDTFTVRLLLNEAYYPFAENLTLGILPAHIWEDIPPAEIPFSTRNTNPIGSGPYAVTDVQRNIEGTIEQVRLETRTTPASSIQTIVAVLYTDPVTLQSDLTAGLLDTTAALTTIPIDHIDHEQHTLYHIALPRIVSLVYNQNRSVLLRDTNVRAALELAIDRKEIVNALPNKSGIPTHTPIPAGYSMLDLLATSSPRIPTSTASTTAAIELLQAGNWEQTDDGVWVRETSDGTMPLQLTIRTLDRPNFSTAAAAVADAWEAIGIVVTVEEFEQRDLVEEVIRPRDFEILLFGMDVTRSVDLFPFWHSSQQSDPGQNIAQYANISADRHLQILRTSFDQTERLEAQQSFIQTLTQEQPALFLYTPTALVIAKNDLNLHLPSRVQSLTDRWSSVIAWYNSTEDIWPWLETYRTQTTNQ